MWNGRVYHWHYKYFKHGYLGHPAICVFSSHLGSPFMCTNSMRSMGIPKSRVSLCMEVLVDLLWIIGYSQSRGKKKCTIVSFTKNDYWLVENVQLEYWLLKSLWLANICMLEFVHVHGHCVFLLTSVLPQVDHWQSRFSLQRNRQNIKLGKTPDKQNTTYNTIKSYLE